MLSACAKDRAPVASSTESTFGKEADFTAAKGAASAARFAAHLAFCAAAIRALPSALIFLCCGLAADCELTGLPRFGEGV